MYCICSYFVWLWRSIIALPFILGCWTDFFTDTRKTRDILQRLICVSHKRASSNNWKDGSAHSDQLISLLKVSFWSISCGIYPPKSWEMSDVVPRHTHTRCKYSSQTLFPQTTNWQDCWNKWETISLQSHLWRRPCGVFPPESLTPGQTEVRHDTYAMHGGTQGSVHTTKGWSGVFRCWTMLDWCPVFSVLELAVHIFSLQCWAGPVNAHAEWNSVMLMLGRHHCLLPSTVLLYC